MSSGSKSFWCFWMMLVAVASSARAGLPSADPVFIAGKSYLRVSDWAKANELQTRWLKRDEALELSNAGAKVALQVHSPEAQINGVAVRLLFPLVQRNDGIYISKLD